MDKRPQKINDAINPIGELLPRSISDAEIISFLLWFLSHYVSTPEEQDTHLRRARMVLDRAKDDPNYPLHEDYDPEKVRD